MIVNAEKAILTGKKLEQKKYYHHSGYIGGLKEVSYKTLMATKPELAMQLAVKGMLPKNSIGRKSFTRLKIYRGTEHLSLIHISDVFPITFKRVCQQLL